MTTGRVYQRDADVLRVIDGDTLLCRVDLGWRAALKAEIRVLGVDAPDDEPARGLAALFVENLLKQVGWTVVVASHRLDPARSFARYLATVTLADGRDLAATLIEAGHGSARLTRSAPTELEYR